MSFNDIFSKLTGSEVKKEGLSTFQLSSTSLPFYILFPAYFLTCSISRLCWRWRILGKYTWLRKVTVLNFAFLQFNKKPVDLSFLHQVTYILSFITGHFIVTLNSESSLIANQNMIGFKACLDHANIIYKWRPRILIGFLGSLKSKH